MQFHIQIQSVSGQFQPHKLHLRVLEPNAVPLSYSDCKKNIDDDNKVAQKIRFKSKEYQAPLNVQNAVYRQQNDIFHRQRFSFLPQAQSNDKRYINDRPRYRNDKRRNPLRRFYQSVVPRHPELGKQRAQRGD